MTAKIYIIFSHKGPKVYIGSTKKQYLCNRISDHKSKYRMKCKNRCSSADLFDEYGIDDCAYKILEECHIANRNEREQYWMDFYPSVVNKNAILTTVERNTQLRTIARHKRFENPEYRAKIRAYENERIKNAIPKLCDCGMIIKGHFSRHKTTQQHTQYIELGPFMHL